MADQYIAMGNCHASLTGWCQQKPGYAEWLNTFDGSLFTRSWRGWKREGISKFHWCGKNTLAEGTSFMFYMNGLIFEVSVFNEKNDLSKKSRSPRLWFFEPCLSFPWCDAILLLRRLARLLKSFARMALPWRPQCERSHLFQVYWRSLGRHATMVLKLQGSCKLAAMALCDLQIFEIAIQDLVLASVVLKDKQWVS